MITLHSTKKLFEKLPVGSNGQLAATKRTQWLCEKQSLDINPLSGWHGNIVTLQRRHCILMAHDATRFPLVLPLVTKSDFAELNDRFVDAFIDTLLKCGVDEVQMSAAERYLRPLEIDTQCNRSVQGTLNRMKDEFEHLLYYDRVNIADISGPRVAAWLADTPRTVKGSGTLWPKKEMLKLLSR